MFLLMELNYRCDIVMLLMSLTVHMTKIIYQETLLYFV